MSLFDTQTLAHWHRTVTSKEKSKKYWLILIIVVWHNIFVPQSCPTFHQSTYCTHSGRLQVATIVFDYWHHLIFFNFFWTFWKYFLCLLIVFKVFEKQSFLFFLDWSGLEQNPILVMSCSGTLSKKNAKILEPIHPFAHEMVWGHLSSGNSWFPPGSRGEMMFNVHGILQPCFEVSKAFVNKCGRRLPLLTFDWWLLARSLQTRSYPLNTPLLVVHSNHWERPSNNCLVFTGQLANWVLPRCWVLPWWKVNPSISNNLYFSAYCLCLH